MNLTKLQDALDKRNARCPICNVRFEVTHAAEKKPAGRTGFVKGQEFIIKKRTIILKVEQPKTRFSISTVTDSVRMKCDKIEDVWQDKIITIHCSNNRHTYEMILGIGLNRFKLTSRDPKLIKETFSFRDEGVAYHLNLNYVDNTSTIVHGQISKSKPTILEVTNKKDIIYKIDRLFNFA